MALTENTLPSTGCLEIEVPVDNVITEENGDALFECEVIGQPVSCVWSKNGAPITNCQRIQITSESKWYRLKIRRVKTSDHGLYAVTFKNEANQVSSAANLFVSHSHLNERVSYTRIISKGYPMGQHLRNAIVVKGDRIELEIMLKMDAVKDYVWFRNNEQLLQSDRVIILNSKTSSILSILRSEVTDSGVYSVVSHTKAGIVSSFANVHVTGVDETAALNEDSRLPIFEEMLPEEKETNEGEDIRLICKAITDLNTRVQWTRNGLPIENSNFTVEYFGDSYIGLKGVNVAVTDKGEYAVVLSDKQTGKREISSTFLTVNSRPTKVQPVAHLARPMDSVVACCGSKVTFDCSFHMDEPKYSYVVWHVGHYRVERTNSRFGVICSGGECILYIKKLEPGMAGEVVCELRKSLPNQKSVLVSNTSAQLTVIPEGYQGRITSNRPKLFNPSHPYNERFHSLNGNGHFNNGKNNGNNRVESFMQKLIMEISYCRLNEEGLYYAHTSGEHTDVSRVLVYNRRGEGSHDRLIVVEWDDSVVPLSAWYEVELRQDTRFVSAGVSSLPSFEVEAPPVGRLMTFRIKTAPVDCRVAESTVYIVPTPEAVVKPPRHHELRSIKEFESKYSKTGDVIGCGAFGSVVLVEDAQREYHAAKVIKTITQKKRDAARREYDTIKKLRHPKLVELIDAFVEKDVFILVMDYLWGGELLDRIVEEDHIKEVDVIPYVRQICEALQYLHSFKIAHLDLKPENVICLSPNSGQVKIIDFGLAKVLDEEHHVKAIYGTRDYVAPEVLNFERLSLACDMWSLGVVTYLLLSGVMPFSGDTWSKISVNITRASYNYEDIAFREISDMAKNFVDHLLLLKPERRMTASEALNHGWIKKGPPKGAKAGHMKRTKENLKSYLANYRARWQRAGNVLIAAHRLRRQAFTHRS